MAASHLPGDTDADLALAQAVASRICHDLVSPVGAVVNGVDLVHETGGTAGPDEMALIGSSAARAGALLEWHRLAFGAGSAEGAGLTRTRLAEMADAVIATKRISVALTPEAGGELPRPAARMAALLLMVGRGLLGMRGALALALPESGIWPMRLTLRADEVPGAEVARCRLAPHGSQPDPRTVEFILLARMVDLAGVVLAVDETPDGLSIEARGAG